MTFQFHALSPEPFAALLEDLDSADPGHSYAFLRTRPGSSSVSASDRPPRSGEDDAEEVAVAPACRVRSAPSATVARLSASSSWAASCCFSRSARERVARSLSRSSLPTGAARGSATRTMRAQRAANLHVDAVSPA